LIQVPHRRYEMAEGQTNQGGYPGMYPDTNSPPSYTTQGQPIQGQPIQGQPIYGQQPYGQQYTSQPQTQYSSQGYPPQGQYVQGQPPIVQGQPMMSGMPMQGQPMQVTIVATPVVGMMPMNQQQMGRWSDGICDCFSDFGNACLACFVAPIRFAYTADRAQITKFSVALALFGFFWLLTIVFSLVSRFTAVPSNSNCPNDDPNCGDYSVANPIYSWIIGVGSVDMLVIGMHYRRRLRYKYNIPGNGCEDCLLHFFCKCCALSQEARHVDRQVGFLPVVQV